MAVQTGEGTTEFIYGSLSIPAGAATLGGYLSRPDYAGEWPTVLVFGPEPTPTSTIKDLCRSLSRHGFVALAPDLTESHATNTQIAMHVAAYVTRPDEGWSNARFGYGALAFGPGIHDATALAANDGRALALAAVGATIDTSATDDLSVADVPILFIGSRDDDSVDIDASVASQEDLPQTTYVIYNDAESRWWDVDAEGFDENQAADTFDRIAAFFAKQLPVRV